MLEALRDPRDDELVAFLREHLRAGQALVQVVGTCEVSYVGRAASFADAGDYWSCSSPTAPSRCTATAG